MSSYEKRMIGLTAAIATISAIYAFFAAGQWYAMNHGLEISARAYITVGDFIPDYRTGSVGVPIENYGHLPAIDVRAIAYEARVRRPDNTVLELHAIGPDNGREIPPGSGKASSNVDLGGWTAEDAIELQSGKETIIIGGRILYNDGFKPREYDYCRQTRLNTTLSAVVWIDCAHSVLRQLEDIESQKKSKEGSSNSKVHGPLAFIINRNLHLG